MYPGDFNGWFALGVIANGFEGADALANMTSNYADYTYWANFIFQAMFAATAASAIVSGAVAERIKLGSFMMGATLLVAFVYPITGSWKWGGGWLDQAGFYDFAGSTLVLCPARRIRCSCSRMLLGSHRKVGVVRSNPSWVWYAFGDHWRFPAVLGWFGFNGGSVLSADPGLVSLVLSLAAAGCAGGLAAMAASWLFLKSLIYPMALNGLLAGLVGITAGADVISPMASIIVGAVAGVL